VIMAYGWEPSDLVLEHGPLQMDMEPFGLHDTTRRITASQILRVRLKTKSELAEEALRLIPWLSFVEEDGL